jgi:hypothetical protein
MKNKYFNLTSYNLPIIAPAGLVNVGSSLAKKLEDIKVKANIQLQFTYEFKLKGKPNEPFAARHFSNN